MVIEEANVIILIGAWLDSDDCDTRIKDVPLKVVKIHIKLYYYGHLLFETKYRIITKVKDLYEL